MKLDICTRREELEALRDAWNRLAAHDRVGGMFATPDWHLSWLRHVAPDAEPAVAVVREGDRVVGLAPLCVREHKDLGFSMPAVRFSGREVVSGDYLDILAEGEARPQVLSLVLGWLRGELDRGRLVLLGEILDEGETGAAIRAWTEREGLDVFEQEHRRCPWIPLPATFDEYLATLSSKQRAHIRRKTRRLTGPEGLEIARLDDPAEVVAALPELFRLHAARWETRGETGTFVRDGFKGFLEDFLENPPPSVRPNLYLLRDADAVYGSLLVLHCGATAMHYQGGWDPDSPYVRYSPGVVLTAASIADAIEAGYDTFDFLRGEEGYKLSLSSATRESRTLVLAGSGLRARAYVRALRMKETAKRILRRDSA